MTGPPQLRRIAFSRIAAAALDHADVLVRRWLPQGRGEGREWIAINPTRAMPPWKFQDQLEYRKVG
jgi:hypothetical protein